MSSWNITPGKLDGVRQVQRPTFHDTRGSFSELWHQTRYAEAGVPGPFVQTNCSLSAPHVLRGLHYQVRHPQAKLVTCISGAIWDVAVDLRPHSPTYLQWQAGTLSAANGAQWYIPGGLAHGFLVLSEAATVVYQCDRPYDPDSEAGIRWNDPGFAIDWPLTKDPVLSDKDAELPYWAEVPTAQRPA